MRVFAVAPSAGPEGLCSSCSRSYSVRHNGPFEHGTDNSTELDSETREQPMQGESLLSHDSSGITPSSSHQLLKATRFSCPDCGEVSLNFNLQDQIEGFSSHRQDIRNDREGVYYSTHDQEGACTLVYNHENDCHPIDDFEGDFNSNNNQGGGSNSDDDQEGGCNSFYGHESGTGSTYNDGGESNSADQSEDTTTSTLNRERGSTTAHDHEGDCNTAVDHIGSCNSDNHHQGDFNSTDGVQSVPTSTDLNEGGFNSTEYGSNFTYDPTAGSSLSYDHQSVSHSTDHDENSITSTDYYKSGSHSTHDHGGGSNSPFDHQGDSYLTYDYEGGPNSKFDGKGISKLTDHNESGSSFSYDLEGCSSLTDGHQGVSYSTDHNEESFVSTDDYKGEFNSPDDHERSCNSAYDYAGGPNSADDLEGGSNLIDNHEDQPNLIYRHKSDHNSIPNQVSDAGLTYDQNSCFSSKKELISNPSDHHEVPGLIYHQEDPEDTATYNHEDCSQFTYDHEGISSSTNHHKGGSKSTDHPNCHDNSTGHHEHLANLTYDIESGPKSTYVNESRAADHLKAGFNSTFDHRGGFDSTDYRDSCSTINSKGSSSSTDHHKSSVHLTYDHESCCKSSPFLENRPNASHSHESGSNLIFGNENSEHGEGGSNSTLDHKRGFHSIRSDESDESNSADYEESYLNLNDYNKGSFKSSGFDKSCLNLHDHREGSLGLTNDREGDSKLNFAPESRSSDHQKCGSDSNFDHEGGISSICVSSDHHEGNSNSVCDNKACFNLINHHESDFNSTDNSNSTFDHKSGYILTDRHQDGSNSTFDHKGCSSSTDHHGEDSTLTSVHAGFSKYTCQNLNQSFPTYNIAPVEGRSENDDDSNELIQVLRTQSHELKPQGIDAGTTPMRTSLTDEVKSTSSSNNTKEGRAQTTDGTIVKSVSNTALPGFVLNTITGSPVQSLDITVATSIPCCSTKEETRDEAVKRSAMALNCPSAVAEDTHLNSVTRATTAERTVAIVATVAPILVVDSTQVPSTTSPPNTYPPTVAKVTIGAQRLTTESDVITTPPVPTIVITPAEPLPPSTTRTIPDPVPSSKAIVQNSTQDSYREIHVPSLHSDRTDPQVSEDCGIHPVEVKDPGHCHKPLSDDKISQKAFEEGNISLNTEVAGDSHLKTGGNISTLTKDSRCNEQDEVALSHPEVTKHELPNNKNKELPDTAMVEQGYIPGDKTTPNTPTNTSTSCLQDTSQSVSCPAKEKILRKKHSTGKRRSYLGKSNYPNCSYCAIHADLHARLEKYFRTNPVPESPDSETTLEMARRHVVNVQRMSAFKAEKPKRVILRVPRRKQDTPCPPLTAPPDLRVEYAVNNEWHRIYPAEWSIQQNITTHGTGVVDLAMLGEYDKQIALKTIPLEDSKREYELIKECQGPFVVQLCASLVQCDTRYLCMTYYERRDLARWLKRDETRDYFGPVETMWICGYILAAIDFIHDKDILHLDIKPGNILIHNNGYPVVGDFGSARRTSELQTQRESFPFTLAYASPEVLAGLKPTHLADLWPLACIYYELMTSQTPFPRADNIEAQLKQTLGSIPDLSELHGKAKNFVISQLRPQIKKRLGYGNGAKDVMLHPIFDKLDWDEVKYGHRHSNCRLLSVFKQIERDEREAKNNRPVPLPTKPYFFRYRNPLYHGKGHKRKNKNNNCIS